MEVFSDWKNWAAWFLFLDVKGRKKRGRCEHSVCANPAELHLWVNMGSVNVVSMYSRCIRK